MLNITAYANAQPVATSKNGRPLKDGWGKPRQTVYLKQTKFGKFTGTAYKDIADYQKEFFGMLERLIDTYPDWARQHGWDQLDKIYNDPVAYSTRDLITDTRSHYAKGHDPALSMILRQKYLARKLAKDIGDNSIINEWDIELTLKNPHEPVLQKFYDKGVFDKTATTSTSFDELFNTK